MKIAWLINPLFHTYEVLLLIRILCSWFPQLQQEPLVEQISRLTDPYLAFFRHWIPPILGVLDISPVLALFLLHWLRDQCARFASFLES